MNLGLTGLIDDGPFVRNVLEEQRKSNEALGEPKAVQMFSECPSLVDRELYWRNLHVVITPADDRLQIVLSPQYYPSNYCV